MKHTVLCGIDRESHLRTLVGGKKTALLTAASGVTKQGIPTYRVLAGMSDLRLRHRHRYLSMNESYCFRLRNFRFLMKTNDCCHYYKTNGCLNFWMKNRYGKPLYRRHHSYVDKRNPNWSPCFVYCSDDCRTKNGLVSDGYIHYWNVWL